MSRIPTQRELEDKTLSYDQIVSTDAAPSTKSLVFSAIRSGNADLLKVPPAMQGRLLRFSFEHVHPDVDPFVPLQSALEHFGPCVTLRDEFNFNTGAYFLSPKGSGRVYVQSRGGAKRANGSLETAAPLSALLQQIYAVATQVQR